MPTLRPRNRPDSATTGLQSALENMTLTRVQRAARVVLPPPAPKKRSKSARRNKTEAARLRNEDRRIHTQRGDISAEDAIGGITIKFENVNDCIDQSNSNSGDAVPEEPVEEEVSRVEDNIEANCSPTYAFDDDPSFDDEKYGYSTNFNYQEPTVESNYDDRWESNGNDYDEELPALISDDGSAAHFSMRAFRERLTAEPACPPYMNIREYLRRRGDMQDNRAISEKFTVEFMEERFVKMPIVDSVLRSDTKAFVPLMLDLLKNCQRERKECVECGCFCTFYFACKRTGRLTLLHIAAAFSTTEFLEHIGNEENIKKDISNICKEASEEERENLFDNYFNAMKTWFYSQMCHDHMNPIELAAEMDRLDVVEVLLSTDSAYRYMEGEKTRTFKYHNRCFKYECDKQDSLLAKIIEHGNFENLERCHRRTIIETLRPEQLNAVIDVAAARGNTRALESIASFQPSASSLIQQRQYEYPSPAPGVPGEVPYSKAFDQFPPVAHALAEYGHFELFDHLKPKEKLATDHSCCTSLLSTLQFTDSQILSQLKYFYRVTPEEAFLFVEQVIVTGKHSIIGDVMKWLLANKEFFNPRYRHPNSGPITEHVSLPLETVIRHNGNMMLFEKIVQCYSKGDKYTKGIISEDGLRCIQLVQDRAHRITDQLRLSVILLCLPLTDTKCDAFTQCLKVYLSRGEEDHVAAYVFKNETKRKDTNMHISWSKAMTDSRKIVSKWKGSVENSGHIPKILGQGRNTGDKRVDMNRELRPIISNDRKTMETRSTVTEDQAVAEIARAFHTFLTEN